MTNIDEAMDDGYARVLAIDAAAGAEILLDRGGAWEAMIERARDEALAAMHQMIHTDFDNLKQVRRLQWRVTRYSDLCRWIKAIEETGKEAREDMTDEEVEGLRDLYRGEPTPEDT